MAILYYMFADHQIRHRAACKMGSQPGDCRWPLYSDSGVCVGIYGLTYSLYNPNETTKMKEEASKII